MALTGPEAIFLQPRPFAQRSGRLLLLPLLPHRRPLKPLPAEIWSDIFAFAFAGGDRGNPKCALSFLSICKSLKDIAFPILYSEVQISDIGALEKFYQRLFSADQKWDSIRRIPYSTPGRWVQILDLSRLAFEGSKQAFLLDSLLTQLFPLTPFLRRLSINPSFIMSRRVLCSLAQREGSVNICALEGLRYFRLPLTTPDEDPFVQLLRHCPNIEQLELIGQGVDPTELEFMLEEPLNKTNAHFMPQESFIPLSLPKLRNLAILSMHSSPLLFTLLHSPLPALQKLMITPYNDMPYPVSLTSEFITVHGRALRSLLLLTPKSWPTRLHPSPENMLQAGPILRHLSLEKPLPRLILDGEHPLEILSIPRPDAEFWPVLEKLLPLLPCLHVVRAREVRWLKKGLSSMAQAAGVQGEMKEWRRRLQRRGIRVLDADWNEFE